MNRRTTIGIGVAAGLLALGGGGAGMAYAVSGDGAQAGGTAGDQARAAAVAAVSCSTAHEVVADNQGGAAYGVTVTKPDGSAVDVRLDQGFHIIGAPMPAGQDGDGDDG